ncbi:MAG: hypothetical protein PHX34_01350 [Candidatus Shapirobacteria bacterium]|nr:hypothetical protein [Candidatus Shapirobacteria bacterium]
MEIEARFLKDIVKGKKGNGILKVISLLSGEKEIYGFQVTHLLEVVSSYIMRQQKDILLLDDDKVVEIPKMEREPSNPEADFEKLKLGSFSLFKKTVPPVFKSE